MIREDHEARQEMLHNLTKEIIDIASKWVFCIKYASPAETSRAESARSSKTPFSQSNHPTVNAWRRFAHGCIHCIYVVETAFNKHELSSKQ